MFAIYARNEWILKMSHIDKVSFIFQILQDNLSKLLHLQFQLDSLSTSNHLQKKVQDF